MSSINQLNAADQISGSDLLPVYSQANGDARKLSLTNFLNWMATQQVTAQDNKVTQYSAPLAASITQVQYTQTSTWLILTPAGTLATATIKLPVVSNVQDKTEVLVNCTQIITTLTIDANGGTVLGAPTTLAANGFFRLRFDIILKTWYRV